MAKSKKRVVTVNYPNCVNEVGDLVAIMYKKKGSGNKIYVHAFNKAPKLYVSKDGRQIIIIGGTFKYSRYGFEDK